MLQKIIDFLLSIFKSKPETVKTEPVKEEVKQPESPIVVTPETPIVSQPKPEVPVSTSGPLIPDYEKLVASIKLDSEEWKLKYIIDVGKKIEANRSRYQAVAKITGVPWDLIAGIHFKEASMSFSKMLHNGEPLNIVSRIVPIGVGPFNTWEESAVDSLRREGCEKIKDWTFATQLRFAEGYNGLGYRKKGIYSPYVMAFTNHSEELGGYPADHVWDPNYVYKRPGVAAILLWLRSKDGPPAVETPATTPDWKSFPRYTQGKGRKIEEELVSYIWSNILEKTGGKVPQCFYDKNPKEIMLWAANSLKKVRESGGNNMGKYVVLIQETYGSASGEAWCMAFVQTCIAFAEMFTGVISPVIASEHCMTTLRESPQSVVFKFPQIGFVIIWEHGKTDKGHTGVVEGMEGTARLTVEGNTSAQAGIVRDGDGIHERARRASGEGDMIERGFIDPFPGFGSDYDFTTV